jgi:hypothetical protein
MEQEMEVQTQNLLRVKEHIANQILEDTVDRVLEHLMKGDTRETIVQKIIEHFQNTHKEENE